MTFDEFLEQNNSFLNITTNDQICRVAWFIHRILKRERFSPKDIKDQFKSAHFKVPRADVYLPRLAEKKSALILYDKSGYYLEGRERKRLEDIFIPKVSTAVVSELLQSLKASVPDGTERVFLDEALRCYQVRAFRAAIVMTWNLAFDHLRRWVLANPERLSSFNDGSAKRFQKSPKPIVSNVDGFDEFKESEFIDACVSGKIINKNLEVMLREKLRRRNVSAHPSNLTIQQPQADDVISDLVRNVVLAL